MSVKNTKIPLLMLSATVSDSLKSFHIFGYMLGFYKNIKQGRNWINGIIREDKNYIGSKPKMSSINKKRPKIRSFLFHLKIIW